MAKKKRASDDGWHLRYDEFKPEEEKLRETLCTVGNGYMGTRGCFPTEKAGENHYPGTYIAGVYNKIPSTVHGHTIYNSDFVNCPNWMQVEFRIGKGKFTSPFSMKMLDYHVDLDMHDATLTVNMRVQDKQKRITRIESERFISMDNRHFGCLRFTVIPENYSETMTIRSALDGKIINDGVARYRNLSNKHLEPVLEGEIDDGVFLHVETNHSHVQIVMCSKNRVRCTGAPIPVKEMVVSDNGYVAKTITFDAEQESAYTLEKFVSIATSRDENTASAFDAARALMPRMTSYRSLLKRHCAKWRALWDVADMKIEGDPFCQKVARLHIYHLLCTASPHNMHIDAGMPARGLNGEAYRGHIFWDSLYILPFYYQRFPEIAKAGLMYRYRRQDAARNYARESGYRGAMYPWQTSDDGQEETQTIHYNPVSGNWDPDLSCRQRHVSIAIFRNIWEYFNYTGDTEWLHGYGAEMLLEIARFWASISTYEKKEDRFHIHGVMGPDEFHEKYEDASYEEGGVSDNAYTNVMVVWLMDKVVGMISDLPEEVKNRVFTKIGVHTEEINEWKRISKRMYVPVSKDGIISQFEGYMDLLELDWDAYREKYGNIHRMDRILKSEGDSPDRYKVAKQADALMLFYVLSPDDVLRILRRLGYKVKNRQTFLQKNYVYYVNRTSHGSTLSKVVHAAVSRDCSTVDDMWKWFMEAMESDIYDTQGGTTPEGIHCGVMAGTINIINRVFAGVTFSDGSIDIKPSLPKHWKRLSFKLKLRGHLYCFEISGKDIIVSIDRESPLTVKVRKD